MALAFFLSVSKKIQTYLTENNISPRRDAGPGIWLTFLLPLSLAGVKHFESSSTHQIVASISVGLLIHSLITLIQVHHNRFFPVQNIILPCIVATGLLYYIPQQGIILSLVLGVSVISAFHFLCLPLMKLCPRSFSYGEATVVLQALLLFILSCFVRNPLGAQTCEEISTVILQMGILCILGIGAASYHFNLKRKPKEFYLLSGLTIIVILLPSLHFLLGRSPLLWIFYLIAEDRTLIVLVSYWVVCCALAALTIFVQSQKDEKASTVGRKSFHILTVLVFAPGIILRPCFMYLASGVALAVLVVLDMLRILSLPVVGEALQTAFLKFGDEKDEGPLALSPIYLLAGCSAPLWLHPGPAGRAPLLPLLSGLLAVGVGDAAASATGSLLGKNKWSGSKKTKEGSAACFLSQLFLVITLIHFGYVPRTDLIKPFFAIAVVSIAEAKTDQIDNLALPLLMYILTV